MEPAQLEKNKSDVNLAISIQLLIKACTEIANHRSPHEEARKF
jgi:hypothetical protein